MKKSVLFFICYFIMSVCFSQTDSEYKEQYRPQIHFSPKQHWTNDPNGMVYNKGVYHLFFQYYPDSSVWGPMHWGHATSTDLIHWQQQPIALYPDSIGYIFSGSAVVDKNNTSGFGKKGEAPLVAIYAQHDPVREKAKRNDFQNQSIAYSLDNGNTWIKYSNNPVLKNPGITDFRDPKVMWYEPQKKWVMTLATKDHITFYSSPDLKSWTKESEFGKTLGAHGGVWECPDLFPLNDNDKQVWVLIVSINPGGPNKGSATQYFLGDFDGKNFVQHDTLTRWIDYGADDYAGVTWSNTGNRKIFLGWMSNWLYANVVPTTIWRNAMTIPRILKLKHAGNTLYVVSEPIKELNKIESNVVALKNISVNGNLDLASKTKIELPCRLDINFNTTKSFSIILSNAMNEQLIIGYDEVQNNYYIDRTNSGKTDFEKNFSAKHFAPRLTDSSKINLSLIVDKSSVELFADDGLTVMTDIFFPDNPYDKINIQSPQNITMNVEYSKLASIW